MPFTAPRDENNIPAKLAVLNTDTEQGQNLVAIKVASNGSIKINTMASISFTMQPVDARDENYVDCWLFQGTDGKTYPAVATADGSLLIDI